MSRVLHCDSQQILKQGRDATQPHRQKYYCKGCERWFDDLTGTVFADHHQPLKTWILCLYFMGVNLSNQQLARELDVNKDEVQRMAKQLRQGGVANPPEPVLSGEVEGDEGYVVAGHKGHPEAVKKKVVRGKVDGSKGPVAEVHWNTRNRRFSD